MMDILNYIGTWSVLQWVILVLIAGFIGQFGRMMAEAVITRVRLRHATKVQLPDDERPPAAPSALPVLTPQPESPQNPAAAVDAPDKKALKIAAKARKKEAKKKLA
jgi:hypothetical protein